MIKPLFKTAFTSLLLSLTLSSQAADDFKPSSPVVTLMPIVIENLDVLGLSKQQLNQIREISRSSTPKIDFINAEYHNLKTELKEILLDTHNQDRSRALSIVKELAELDRKRLTLTVECAFNLKKVLGTEKFQEVVSTLEFQSN
ncbi:hypothetical protein [Thiomicrorhabdus sp. Kp2]|uniref:hypothetical protein n=1 Tax=Thiomicrorhabdus sp. Kp2 TaxID=1123518 RepID=UPI000415477D|nr:hypothetical protein [Thiomicrorhabdus sp. Kp2]